MIALLHGTLVKQLVEGGRYATLLTMACVSHAYVLLKGNMVDKIRD